MYATTNKTAEIRSRIEPSLKEESSEVLASLGLDMSDAIRLFLRQVVEVGGLPFALRRPTPETAAAVAEARTIKRGRFGSVQELIDDLDAQVGHGKKSGASPKV